MKIIGVTGNTGSGKTLITSFFEHKNSYIISLDKVGHLILAHKEVIQEICFHFGKDVLNKNYEIDRKKLRDIVFNDKEKLEILNSITHKRIEYYVKNEIQNKTYNSFSYIIIDGLFLFEFSLNYICDFIIVCISDLNNRIERISKRDNITNEDSLKIINSQKSNEYFKNLSSNIVYNNFSKEILFKNLENVLRSWND